MIRPVGVACPAFLRATETKRCLAVHFGISPFAITNAFTQHIGKICVFLQWNFELWKVLELLFPFVVVIVLVVFKLSRLQSSFALIQTTGNSSSITHAEADWFPIKELNLEVS